MAKAKDNAHPFDLMTGDQLMFESLDALRRYGVEQDIRLKPKNRGRKASWVNAILKARGEEPTIEEDGSAEFPADSTEQATDETEAVEELETAQDEAVVSPREARKLDSASTESLRSWLERHATDEVVKPCLLDYARLVITRREAEAAELERLEALRTADDAERYIVERHTRICVGGFVHSLAAGSVVCSGTHDLAELRRQGVTLRKVETVLTELDLVGVPKTVIR